ncbi:MAG: 6-bladed beta-propeller [Candidatus Aminicenantes bacterium]|nr:6-bladed beta-propeller [Candidatus Aminicenantes bacterium]
MKKNLLIFLLAALFIWSACSKKPESAASVEVIDGVEYIHNTATPLYPEKNVSFEEDLSIEPEDEEGNILLYYPGRYAVDNNENIYISDYQDQVIKVFDPKGQWMRTIGRKGNGPGEFQNIGRLVLLPDGRLLVLDGSIKRLSLFDAKGNFINNHNFQNNAYNIFLAGPSFYAREEITYGKVIEAWLLERLLHVKAYDYSGNELFSFGEFVHYHSQVIDEEGRRFTISPKPFDVRSILVGDSINNRLFHCLNDKYLIEVYSQDGKLFRKIDRPYQLLPVTEEDKKKYVEGFTRSSEKDRALIEKNVVMPKLKPITDTMIVDDAGNLWVKTHEEKEEGGVVMTAYDIFNPDGHYAFRVWKDIQPGFFKKGKMYRMKRDEETGYRTLKRYRIIWSD